MLTGKELLTFTLRDKQYSRHSCTHLARSIETVYRECRIKPNGWELVKVEMTVDVTKEYLDRHKTLP